MLYLDGSNTIAYTGYVPQDLKVNGVQEIDTCRTRPCVHTVVPTYTTNLITSDQPRDLGGFHRAAPLPTPKPVSFLSRLATPVGLAVGMKSVTMDAYLSYGTYVPCIYTAECSCGSFCPFKWLLWWYTCSLARARIIIHITSTYTVHHLSDSPSLSGCVQYHSSTYVCTYSVRVPSALLPGGIAVQLNSRIPRPMTREATTTTRTTRSRSSSDISSGHDRIILTDAAAADDDDGKLLLLLFFLVSRLKPCR